MSIIAHDEKGLQKFLELFAESAFGTVRFQGALVKSRMMSEDWCVCVADGSNPDSLMALGDFLGYGAITDHDLEMFSFPVGPLSLIVATLRAKSFDLEMIREYFPDHPEVSGHGWETQKPSLVFADYGTAPGMFDGFMTWLEGCAKELN